MRQLSPQMLWHFRHLRALSPKISFAALALRTWLSILRWLLKSCLKGASTAPPLQAIVCQSMRAPTSASHSCRASAALEAALLPGCRRLGHGWGRTGYDPLSDGRHMAAAHHEQMSFVRGKRGSWKACAAGLLVSRVVVGLQGTCGYAPPPYSARTTDSTSLRSSSGCC